MFQTQNLWKRSFFIFLILPFCFSVQKISGQNTAEITSLELGKSVERELAGDQKHSYQVSLSANQFMLVTIQQRGINVTARVSDAEGKSLVSYDAEMRVDETEKIEFVAKTDGIYQIDIEPVYKLLPAGKYEIQLTEIRAANEADQILFDSRLSFAEAYRLFRVGKYAESKQLTERVIENRVKTVGLENPLTAEAMSHLARLLGIEGKLDEDIKLNERVLAVREKILDANHPDIARSLHFLATDYAVKEDYETAILYYQRALAIWEKSVGRNHPSFAITLKNLGLVYMGFGDKPKALELFTEALAIIEQTSGKENINAGTVLNELGGIYFELGEYDKAESFAVRSIDVFEKLSAPDKTKLFPAHLTLASIYEKQAKLDEAEAIYLRVLETHEKRIENKQTMNIGIIHALANIYALKGDFEKSESFYRRAIEIAETGLGTENSRVSEGLHGLVLVLARKGDIGQAIKLQQRAAQINERNISLNLAIGSERQKLAYINNMTHQLEQNIFLQTRFAPDRQEAVELAATTILRQKGRVLDAVSNTIIQLLQRLDAKDQSLLDELNDVTTRLAGLILNKPQDMSLSEHQEQIKNLTEKREDLEDEISRRVAGFYVKSEPVTLNAVQAVIPQNSVLVEFAVYTPAESDLAVTKKSDKPRYVAYVISNTGKINWTDIGQTDEIDPLIEKFREALSDPKSKDIQKIARALDEKLMKPVRTFSGNKKQLLISPDGALNLIPFEALIDENGHYLIENYSFTYLTSGRDLLRLQTARESKSKSLIIANPSFGVSAAGKTVSKKQSVNAARDLPDTYFAPLAGTVQEARSIQKQFPAAIVLTEDKANENALKQTVAPRILHIASHGFFLENTDELNNKTDGKKRGGKPNTETENPLLRSGIALAGANEREANKSDDGILTALEASGLNLWETKLVVLSACDTGVGDVKNGEGVYGSRRAFVLAGTESLVMSLWSVSDAATRELMTGYYKNLKNGDGRGEALRKVKLEMLKKKGREHPFYWAAFIQTGEWANLDGKR